jgi:DNA-binding transcriptional regulator WhiA
MRSRILKKNLELSEYQKQVLFGLILGDGCLVRWKTTKATRLSVCQSLKQKDFVVWLYKVFKEFVRTPPKPKIRYRNGKQNTEVWFNTLTYPAFQNFYDLFYPQGEKIVPESIDQFLTKTAFAVWFMSDGSVKSKQSRGRILNTQSFTRPDIEKMVVILKSKFNLQSSIRTQKDGLQIYISGKSAEILDNLLREKILPFFYYKLPLKS